MINEKWKNANNKYKKEWNEAFDLAIEALSAELSATNTEKSSNCGDLISRAEVHKTLSLLATEGGTDAKMLLADAHEFIDALPSADRPSGEWVECER